MTGIEDKMARIDALWKKNEELKGNKEVPTQVAEDKVEQPEVVEENKEAEAEVVETENSSLKETEKQEVTEEKEAVSTNQNQPDYEEYIKENGYISKDEHEQLQARIQELENSSGKFEIEDPLLKALFEKYEAGEEITLDYLQLQTTDFESMSDEEVIKRNLMRQGYSSQDAQDEIDLMFEDLRDYDPEDREYKRAERKRRLEANKARREMEAYKEANKLPNSQARQEAVEAQRQQQEFQQNWQQTWSNAIPKETEKLNEVSLGEDLSYEVSKEDKKLIQRRLHKSIVEGFDMNLAGQYWNGTTWDINSMMVDEMWRTPEIRERMLSKFTNEVESKGSEKIIKEIKNAKVSNQVGQDEVAKSERDKKNNAYKQLANYLKNGGR